MGRWCYAEEVGGEGGDVWVVVCHWGYQLGDDGVEGERKAENTVEIIVDRLPKKNQVNQHDELLTGM